MTLFTDLFSSFGNFTLEQLWFPLLVWTIIAVPIAVLLHRSDSISPVFQYHGRVALLLALPFGIGVSYLLEVLSDTTTSAVASTKFFVVQTPIPTATSVTEPSLLGQLSDPIIWVGVAGLLMIIGALYYLLKMLTSYIQLRTMENKLNFMPLREHRDLLEELPNSTGENFPKTLLAFSKENKIPFTYGLQQTKIVIPAYLADDTEALAMAIQHELMHIKHHDYLLNGILLAVKSVFWIHPLAHYLHNSSREYREIICDAKVLANNHFSKKRYASLLFNLAQKGPQTKLAMSMAVDLSTLKKRIQIMSDRTFTSTSFRSSFLVAFLSAGLIVLAMGCSDMSDDSITKAEFQEAQTQLSGQQQDNAPLYVLNGDIMAGNEENNDKLARIKPKYIKSINVLKNQKAIDKYGDTGKNGVIELHLADGVDKETAFADLKDKPGSNGVPPLPPEKKDYYMATENMPELVGGLAGLQQKVKYPENAAKKGIEGTVSVRFIVDKQGNVKDPEILRGVGGGLDEEALRVVKLAEFNPGKDKDGNPVRVQYSLPIRFQLASNTGKK